MWAERSSSIQKRSLGGAEGRAGAGMGGAAIRRGGGSGVLGAGTMGRVIDETPTHPVAGRELERLFETDARSER